MVDIVVIFEPVQTVISLLRAIYGLYSLTRRI